MRPFPHDDPGKLPRTKSEHARLAALLVVVLVTTWLQGCSALGSALGTSTSTPTPSPAPPTGSIAVTVTPASTTVILGNTHMFSARCSPERSAGGAAAIQAQRNSMGVIPSSGSRWATPTPCMPNRWTASCRRLKSTRRSHHCAATPRQTPAGRSCKTALCPQWTPALRLERDLDRDESCGRDTARRYLC